MGTPATVDLIVTKDSDGNDVDLRIPKGSDYRIVFQHTTATIEAAYGTGNTLASLGFTAKAQIRERQKSTSTLIDEFTVVISGNDITLSLTKTQTAAITRSTGFYDLKVTDYADFTEPWYEGDVEFKDGPTDTSS